jgi:hypothetical protein
MLSYILGELWLFTFQCLEMNVFLELALFGQGFPYLVTNDFRILCIYMLLVDYFTSQLLSLLLISGL